MGLIAPRLPLGGAPNRALHRAVLPRFARCRRLSPALALLLLAGCSEDEEKAPPAPAPAAASAPAPASASAKAPAKPQPQPPYNVILIMIDSLRGDMPWAGYPRKVAPWLTEFASKSTLYVHSYSLSSYTAKSVAPALTGKYPSEMARDGYFFTKWLPSNEFISERASAAGHRTLAGHAHGYFLPNLGMNQGFDDYRLLPGTVLDVTGVANVTSDKLTGLAKEMLSDPKNVKLPDGKRFFAYFHYLDPHYTYFKHPDHPDYGTKRRDLYDNEVHYSDEWVGKLVDWVHTQPWSKETAIIITADHGEGFGERNHYRHAYELWQSLVWVPTIIHVPGAPARRIETPRGHIDLAPTISDLMGLEQSAEYRGQSLVPEVFGAKAEERPVIVDLPRCDLMDRRRGLIWKGWKLVAFGDDKHFFLFHIAEDPWEEHDLSEKNPEKLAELKALYEKLSKKIETKPVIGGVPLKGAPPGQRY